MAGALLAKKVQKLFEFVGGAKGQSGRIGAPQELVWGEGLDGRHRQCLSGRLRERRGEAVR
jgi:hypothetical protein